MSSLGSIHPIYRVYVAPNNLFYFLNMSFHKFDGFEGFDEFDTGSISIQPGAYTSIFLDVYMPTLGIQ